MKEHKKLYKAGKLWVTATLFSLVGIALATTNASADDSTSPVDNNQQTLVVNNSQAPESSTTLNQSEYQSSDNIQDLQNRVNDAQQKVDQAQQDVNNAQSNVDNQQSVVNNDKNNLQTAQNNLQAAGGDQSTVSESITLSSDWINAVKNQLNSNSSTMNVDPSSNFGQELSNYGSSLLSQNKYISDPALQKINVKLTADGVLDPSTELEVTRYAISLLNPIREQLGVDQYQITQQALDDSTNIAKQYVADNWTLFNHGTHDFQALYNNHQDGESMSDGYLTFSNDQATLDSIHEAIYDSILSMLFGDAGSYWGHMTDLAGIRGWANGIYFGVQVDRNGQVHFNGNMVKIEGRQYGSEISDSPLQFKYYTGHPDTSARIPLTADESSQTQQLKQAVQDAQNQLNQDTNTLNSYQQDLTNAQSTLQQAHQDLQQAKDALAAAQQPGWGTYENGNKYYQDSNGNHVDGWQYIDNQWYYFNNQILVTNQVDYVPGNYAMQSGYYYFDNNGKYMINGFAMDAKFNLYYFGNDGCAITGLHQINSAWYYFDPSTCIAQKGFVTVNNNLYDFGDDLSAQSGWQYNVNNGNNYYFDPSTKVAVNGLQNIDGNIYYFENNARVDNQTLNLPSENGVPGGTYSFDNNGIGTLQPTIQTGWQTENGNKYYRDDNGNLVDGWQKIDGQWYYFNNTILATNQMLRVPGNSEMQAGLYCFNNEGYYITYSLIHDSSNNCYYFGSDGRAVTGLNNILGTLYYFNPSTSIEYKGWKLINGDYYFFNPAAVNGLQKIGDSIYYFKDNKLVTNQTLNLPSSNGIKGGTYKFDKNGHGKLVPQSGWKKINNSWEYLDDNGSLANDWRYIDGQWYYFNNNILVENTDFYVPAKNGFAEGLYYFNKNGHYLINSWRKVSMNTTYYFGADGRAVSGWQSIGGQQYYFDNDSHAMYCDGLAFIPSQNGSAYYFDNNGHYLTNVWEKDAQGHDYYFGSDGRAVNGFKVIAGTPYFFSNCQLIKNNWQSNSTGTYFVNASGHAVNGWQLIGSDWYYFDNYRLVTNQVLKVPSTSAIKGGTYYFNQTGHYLTNTWRKDAQGYDYYFGSDGRAVNGFKVIAGTPYFFSNCQLIKNNWQSNSTGTYFVNASGHAVNGWQLIGSDWYYFDNYRLVTNQVLKVPSTSAIKGGTYYFNQTGHYLTNTWRKDAQGYDYYFGSDGRAVNGFKVIAGTPYFFSNCQLIKNNWQSNSTGTYFVNASGHAVNGWQLIGSDWYYFDNYRLVTNQVLKVPSTSAIKGGTYYFNQTGHYLTNTWRKDAQGYDYYFGSDGRAVNGFKVIAGTPYFFSNCQLIKNNWQSNSTGTYFVNASGHAVNGWQLIDSDWYYFDNYRLVTNQIFKVPSTSAIKGGTYYFNQTGHYLTNTWKKDKNSIYHHFGMDGREID